ncbi:MAG: DUF5317 domain-containing protein [Anaerolineaceae bacterium]|nr:DUF5317 domain-containing protein [Anaerolineaceae bacterium]
MILLTGIVLGLLAAFVRSKIQHRPFIDVELHGWWLVFLAFIPQALIFGPLARLIRTPDVIVPFLFAGSLMLLLCFAWFNYSRAGFKLLGLGLLLNFAAILLNGGWMPISPETVQAMAPKASPEVYQVNQRLADTKDWIVDEKEMRLSILSDRFVIPAFRGQAVAFSMGDVLIALGAFWYCYSLSGAQPKEE